MDGQRFDRWTRTLATASSRRGFFRGLAGTLAAGLVAAEAQEAEAAPSCRRQPNGTRCGECGVCRNQTCVVDPSVHCDGCQRCSSPTMTCKPTNDACAVCEKCERDGGAYRCKRLNCGERTHCCNHRCIPKEVCCTDRDCPECGRCERGNCKPNPAKNGQKCGTSGCEVCKNGKCEPQIDNAGCFDRNGLCCRGVCCAPGKSCCGGTCCTDGLCVGDVCCDFGGASLSAAEAEVCCPFGPPCGEGNAAKCCQEGETCCDGICCPEGKTCADEVCGGCPQGETPCGGDCCDIGTVCCNGVCCKHLESCSLDGCCLTANRCPNVGLPEFARCCAAPDLCFWDGGTTVACCPGPGGDNGTGVPCSYGCCATGLICDNSCKDFPADGDDCCHVPGLNPVPLICENLQCQDSFLPE